MGLAPLAAQPGLSSAQTAEANVDLLAAGMDAGGSSAGRLRGMDAAHGGALASVSLPGRSYQGRTVRLSPRCQR